MTGSVKAAPASGQRKVAMPLRVLAGVVALAALLAAVMFIITLGVMLLTRAWLEAASQLIGLVGAMAVLNVARLVAGKGTWDRPRRHRLLFGVAGVGLAFAMTNAVGSVFAESKRSSSTRGAMRGTLHELATAESAYYAAQGRFTADFAQLAPFAFDTNVRVVGHQIDSARGSAVAAHRNTTRTCRLSWAWEGQVFVRHESVCDTRGRWRKEFPRAAPP